MDILLDTNLREHTRLQNQINVLEKRVEVLEEAVKALLDIKSPSEVHFQDGIKAVEMYELSMMEEELRRYQEWRKNNVKDYQRIK